MCVARGTCAWTYTLQKKRDGFAINASRIAMSISVANTAGDMPLGIEL
jgi:hypothetical protein